MKRLIPLVLFLAGLSQAASNFGGYQPYGDLHWKAPVASVAALPSVGNIAGDTRIETTGFNIYTWNGSAWVNPGGGGTGSVTSVAATVPAYMSVSGSPVTSSGTLGFSFNSQSGNKFFASPSNGSSGAMSMRAVVAGDIPTLNQNTTGTAAGLSATLVIASGGTNSSTALNSNRFIISSAGKIVETSAIAASVAVVTDSNGLPIGSSTTATQIGYLSTTTSDVQTQLNAITNGIVFKAASQWATTAALPTNIYSNGSSGVGATLTGVSLGALTVDGNAVIAGNRILVKNEVADANNGIYVVTVVGSAGAVYVLTRATDFNSASDIDLGSTTFVLGGTVNADTTWTLTTTGTITVGSTSLTFGQTGGTSVGVQSANRVYAGPTSGGAATPTFRALVGADLPNPSSSTLGGVQSYAAVSNQWINTISTSGVPASSQPAFSNLSGNIATSQMNSGTGATASTFFRGDGTWATPAVVVPTYTPLTKTTTYTLVAGDVVAADATSASFTLTLPDATTNAGKAILVARKDSTPAFLVTIAAAGSDTFNGGDTTMVLVDQNVSVTLVSIGSIWFVF